MPLSGINFIFEIENQYLFYNMRKLIFLFAVILFISCEKDDDGINIQIPVALEATEVKTKSFKANWIPSYRATAIEIDIATDLDFNNIIYTYKIEYPGNIKSGVFYVYGLTSDTEYFYRLRGLNINEYHSPVTENSNIISVTTLAE